MLALSIFLVGVYAIYLILRRQRMENPDVRWGYLNHAIICPHCGSRGVVRTRSVQQKRGISGAKATGAILTGGVSLLATGLSRKENATAAHCDHCGSDWAF